MKIRLLQNSKRRCAFTDRKNGYIQLVCSNESDKNESGYYRENRKFFSGFSVLGSAFYDAKSINVFPEGFSIEFDSASLSGALLLDEQAFYLSECRNLGILGINKIDEDSDVENSSKDESEEKSPATSVQVSPSWSMSERDGIHVLSSGTGIAVAAIFDFDFKIENFDLELFSNLAEEGQSKANFPFGENGWYLAMEESGELAVEKAVRLATEHGIKAHVKKIEDFLSNCNFNSGDKGFDEAFQWARFNAWLLATKNHDSDYRGIWAGLPWFRDNWGRDTFISLCGTLLVSGCFDEAKNVLLGFAGFQDLDEKSPTYGRIPNRYRNAEDVIYNTADGTLWFIRALWEYVQYSGDMEIIESLSKTVEIALDADIVRSDGNGFLRHGDADTWMDARISGNEPWSPRGDRSNDVQALWYTALKIGAIFMKKLDRADKANVYDELASKIKKSFEHFFWNEDCNALADHLPEGGYGEWAKDMRVRPNQLFAITAPSVLPQDKTSGFINENISEKVMENMERELVNPFGLYSLSPEDPIFHSEHENPSMHNKDAAYHNGTIWEWISGPYISAAALRSKGELPLKATAILQNEAKMIMDYGCAGSLSENIHARPDENGNPKLSGTFSQAWSLSEFVRNVSQDLMGFVPRLLEGRLSVFPCLPAGCEQCNANLPFGKGWSLSLNVSRSGKNLDVTAEWICGDENYPEILLNEQKIVPGKKLNFKLPAEGAKDSSAEFSSNGEANKFGLPSKWITEMFPNRELSPEWNGAAHIKDYLENVILSGRMKSKTCGGENTAFLEWYFDSEDFKKKYLTDEKLGAIYSRSSTIFRLWAPTARSVSLKLYSDGECSVPQKIIPMKLCEEDGKKGIWETQVEGDLHGIYYEYEILAHGVYNHTADPYAHAAGINGNRSMVVDMARTNPTGWENSSAPGVASPSDVIAWEVHVADITSSPTWNGSEKNRRLFTGVSEKGTRCSDFPSGFDYIKSLGVTHVQFLPIFDFRSVDEKRVKDSDYRKKPTFGAFNWGYDPENYGLPEGSYSSDPFNGTVRIFELKSMIQAFNEAGIGVIMDVVFNHVNDGLHQSLGISVPGYFFRVEGYSGAGEDTASEREMFRKYMVDMLCFWLKEYKLSGFRFDLMGLHDVDTMNEIERELKKIKKDVIIYGEGWQMYGADKMVPSSMCNASKMPGIGHFNDAFRCAVKGSAFDDNAPGFIHNGSHRESVKFGIVGATLHPDMNFLQVDGTANPNPWTKCTWNSVNYIEIHDNLTLNDKIRLVEPGKSESYYNQLGKMALSLLLLSEGLPILHAGMEFLRTKEIPVDILDSGADFPDVAYSTDDKAYLRNSYNVCDRINALDWHRAYEKQDLVNYTKNLIALRKAHPAFRIPSGKLLAEALEFLDNEKEKLPEQILAWKIDGKLAGDTWSDVLIFANPLDEEVPFSFPELSENKKWFCVTDGIDFTQKEDEISAVDEKFPLKGKSVSVFASK